MSLMRLIVPGEPAPVDVVGPSEDEVLMAVKSLDGTAATELYLQLESSDPETYLAVAGGAEGRYLVFICYSNERFVEARSPYAAGGEVELVCGGQPGWYAPSELVDLEEACRAAAEFCRSGTAADSIHWVRR